MSDESAPRPNRVGHQGAVARLTKVLAEAQAVARAGAHELGAGQSSDEAATQTDVRSPVREVDTDVATDDHGSTDADPRARSLRDRIDDLDDVETPTAPAHTRQRPRRLWPMYATIAVLVLAVPLLAAVGYRLTSESTTGEVISGVSQPDEPGYSALVEPTPVALVMHVSDSGKAESLTLLSLSGPAQKGGSVVSIPVATRLAKARYGIETFAGIVDVNATRTAGAVIGREIGVGFTEVIKITSDELSRFLDPVAPLEIENPVDVTTADGAFIPAGTRTLDAAQIIAYLTAEDAQESVEGRLQRQQLVWKAWLKAIASAKGQVGVVPGETTSGLGRFLTGLAAGTVATAALPTYPAPEADGQAAVKILLDRAHLMLANAVPLSVGATPGSRTTVSLLNGTGPGPAPVSVLQRLNYGGAQIISVGNAPKFGVETTTVTYSDPKVASEARTMASLLGVGRVKRVRTADANPQVTIVMGSDLLDDPPGRLTVDDVVR